MPHTLPESVRSFSASKKPKLLTQQASPMLFENKSENCGNVIEVDQTAPLTSFCMASEELRRECAL
jgi:hypothetical protein